MLAQSMIPKSALLEGGNTVSWKIPLVGRPVTSALAYLISLVGYMIKAANLQRMPFARLGCSGGTKWNSSHIVPKSSPDKWKHPRGQRLRRCPRESTTWFTRGFVLVEFLPSSMTRHLTPTG